MADLPIIITAAGLQPTPPATINADLIAAVAAVTPGYTAVLPGSLVEDISSTDTAAIVMCDQAMVDTVNSLTPYGANQFLLWELGQMLGIPQGTQTNTSVELVFTGTPGTVIAEGFLVSDGTYQYEVQAPGGVINSDGVSAPLYAIATITGSWAVLAGTVTEFVTSAPPGLSGVSNPDDGTPGAGAETEASYRARVLQANLAASMGMARYLYTLVQAVEGVQANLVSVRQQSGGGWEVIVGGGDPYEVAFAIYYALFDVSSLVGSVMAVTAITQAANGQVTTALNHGYSAGQVIVITGIVGMTELNGATVTVVDVIDEKDFTINVDTTSYDAYVSGGVITPNLRNTTVALQDYPDVFAVTFVVPPQQTVALVVTWNTTSTNYVNPAAISQAAQQPLVDYINAIVVGQPINLYEMITTFQAAVQNILPLNLLTELDFAVSINGIAVEPVEGTGIFEGDPESYFFTTTEDVVISQAA